MQLFVSSLALRNAATATSLTLYKRKHLLQWRVEQQQSVSHHHPEDSHYEDQDHVNPSWSEGIEVKNHYCKIFPSFIFSFLQLKLKFPTPSPDLFDLKSSSLYRSYSNLLHIHWHQYKNQKSRGLSLQEQSDK